MLVRMKGLHLFRVSRVQLVRIICGREKGENLGRRRLGLDSFGSGFELSAGVSVIVNGSGLH